MNIAWITFALVIGAVIGALYFGGLWITVRRLVVTRQPALLLLLSFIVRAAVVVLGFYFVMDGRWERLIACFAGFLLARILLVRRLSDLGKPDTVLRLSGETLR